MMYEFDEIKYYFCDYKDIIYNVKKFNTEDIKFFDIK